MQNNSKKTIKITTLSIFFLFIIFYSIFVSRDIILGVKIKNINMQNGIKLTSSIFQLTGKAKNATNLQINGREISVDQKGNFNETIALLSGYNMINIKARDKFGNVDEKNYQVMY